MKTPSPEEGVLFLKHMAVKKVIQKILAVLLEIVFPITCLGCGKDGYWLCASCEQGLALKPRYFKTGPFSYLDGLFAATAYEENVVQEAIHLLKYNGVVTLAPILATCFLRSHTQWGQQSGTDLARASIVLPVPLHRKRERERGFNQSELIAKELTHSLDLALETKVLIRSKNTAPQVSLGSEERLTNIRNAFKIVRYKQPPKHVILFDDVATTCATLEECASVLKKAGTETVIAWVIAKASNV